MRVNCTVRAAWLEGDQVPEVEGIEVRCGRCGTIAEAFGTSDLSVRAALTKLREGCLKKETNFYADAAEKIDTRGHVRGPIDPMGGAVTTPSRPGKARG